jgi:hypothetical protein
MTKTTATAATARRLDWTDCTCVEWCEQDPHTACSLHGTGMHQHSDDPCPVHPDAPGDR